jgi:hypothetical protein
VVTPEAPSKLIDSVLAVDPGKEHAGVALGIGGSLKACALIQPEPANPYNVGKHTAFWSARLHPGRLDLVICEGQQIYRGVQGKDPNDLLDLTYVTGAVHARVHADRKTLVLPRVWTGKIPKEVRLRRVLAALKPDEIKLVEDLNLSKAMVHNVIDAIGIYLFATERLVFGRANLTVN